MNTSERESSVNQLSNEISVLVERLTEAFHKDEFFQTKREILSKIRVLEKRLIDLNSERDNNNESKN